MIDVAAAYLVDALEQVGPADLDAPTPCSEWTVRDLLDPAFHFRTALALLAEFAEDYQLDVTRAFEEMFRCWNTGKPYAHPTTDPVYVTHALRRIALSKELRQVSR